MTLDDNYDDDEDAELHGGSATRAPRYEAEDVSPTSEKELRGWYSCGLAAEIFAVCGVGKSTWRFCKLKILMSSFGGAHC